MDEMKKVDTDEIAAIPDGKLERKMGSTTYRVNVYFNHDTKLTAKDRIERLIMADFMKEAG